MDLLYIATFLVALLSSIISGIAGSGGGYIMSPYWLITGMTPAQSATTGACMALGMSASSLAAFKGTSHYPTDRRLMIILSVVTCVSAVIGGLILPHFSTETFKLVIGVVTLVSLPLLFINRRQLPYIRHAESIGIVLLCLLLFAGSIIVTSGFSILIAIVLSIFLDLSVLQSTALRRLLGISQSLILFILLAAQGNFVWMHAAMGLLGGILGSYIGTKLAIKRGEKFAKYALAIGATISCVVLFV